VNRRLVRDHWYRARNHRSEPCVFQRGEQPCGQPYDAHVQAVGEWMDAAHWFRPRLRCPLWCASCGRHAQHGTHHFTRRRRRLYGWTVR
jgi:hypothetical protein